MLEPKTRVKGFLIQEFVKDAAKAYKPADGSDPLVASPVAGAFRAENPRLRIPAVFIVDDGMPIIRSKTGDQAKAKAEFESKWNTLRAFAELCVKHGARGKFSVIPYIEADNLGMMDKIADPDALKMLHAYLDYVREWLAPRFDLNPEVNTHGAVLDLETDRPYTFKSKDVLKEHPEYAHESDWSLLQDEDTLARYIERALTAHKNVGLEPNGLTCCCNFGIGNEDNFVPATARAFKNVFGRMQNWFFKDVLALTRIEQQVMNFNWQTGEYLVHIGCAADLCDLEIRNLVGDNLEKQLNAFIAEDGQSGNIPRIMLNKGQLIFCVHWWYFLEDMALFRGIFERMERLFPDRYVWMKASELSRYTVAARTFRQVMGHHGRFRLETAVECPDFTLSFEVVGRLTDMCVNDVALKRDSSGNRGLDNGFWRQDGHVVYACFDLKKNTNIALQAEF